MKAIRAIAIFLTPLLLGTISTYARDDGLDAARGGPNHSSAAGGGGNHSSVAPFQSGGGFNRGPANFGGASTRNPMTGSQMSAPPSFTHSYNVPATRSVTLPSPKPSTGNTYRPITGIPTISPPHSSSPAGSNPSTKALLYHPEIRPSTRPGNVTYPSLLPSGRPGTNGNKSVAGLTTIPQSPAIGGNKTITGLTATPKHPHIGGTLPGFTTPGHKPGSISNAGTIHPGIIHPFNHPPGSATTLPWWGGNGNGGHHAANIVINNNFKHNWNWSLSRKCWGFRPWWNLPTYYPWYGGHWNCGWNYHYYHWHHWYQWYPSPWPGYVIDDDPIGWGLAAWGLGDLIYDLGYLSYCNPYPVTPIVVSPESTISYDQPMAAIASTTAPGDENAAKSAEEQSQAALDESRAAFKNKDYLAALPLADKAVSLLPADSVLHEYRALVLFALGKYSDCAGVLNSILASGPGWNWTTMIQLYDSQETYTAQLRKLEEYVEGRPRAADARFVLGYHYLVCNHLESAAASFEAVTKLQPADTVAKQLYNLCLSSTKPGEASEETADDNQPAADPPDAPPVDQLVGTWKADNGKNGTVLLDLGQDGKFTWTFTKNGKKTKLQGEFSMNEKGLLVLAAGDTQMVGAATMPNERQLRFVLAGGPEGDPGLLFTAVSK